VIATPENVLLPMTIPGGPIEKAAWIGKNSFRGPIGLLGTMPNLVNFISGGRTALNDGNFSPGIGLLSSDAPVSAQGKAITSYDTAVTMGFIWQDCPSGLPIPLPAFILPGPVGAGVMQTKKGGGIHSSDSFMGIDLGFFSSPHKGSKHDWDPDPGKFMEYNISTNPKESLTVGPYGQPIVFAKASASLRVSDQGKTGGPWEINPNGVSIDVGGGAQGKGKVVIGDDRADAEAISKALVYYHRIGDWREPPNLFNPYWRAKLEPWTEVDLPEAMTLAGQAGSIPAIEEMQLLGKGAVNLK